MIGLLLLIIAGLVWVIVKYRKELVARYRERDLCRLVNERFRAALVAHEVPVPNIDDLVAMMNNDGKD